METGILYIIFNKWITNPETNEMPYKIGITKYSIDERYYGLGLKMPGEFETLFAYRIKNYIKAERSVHDIFCRKCVNGEWFLLNKDDIALIEEICKKMEGELITDEIKNDIENEINAETNIENHAMSLEDLIRTIGMKTFIQYYDKFKGIELKEIIDHMRLHENYRSSSIRTKASTGKRIFREKLEKQALEIISKSEKADKQTINGALELLKKNFK